MKVSTTSISAFNSCRRKYYLRKTIPFSSSVAFEFGKAFESSFEEAYKENNLQESVDKWNNKFKEVAFEYAKTSIIDKRKKKGLNVTDKIFIDQIDIEAREVVDSNSDMFPEMVERLYNFIKDNNIKFIHHQLILMLNLNEYQSLEARFDGLVEYEGNNYIFELKSYKAFTSKEDLQFNDQLLTYSMVAKKKGLDVKGVMFCQNKKVKVVEPKILEKTTKKDGTTYSLSTDKRQKCCPEKYLEVAERLYGSDIPDKVLECYTELSNTNIFIKMDIIEFSEKQLNNYYERLLYMIEDLESLDKCIRNNEENLIHRCYPTRSRENCSMCSYVEECNSMEEI